MPKKRVLFIIEQLTRGGAERVVVELARRIDRERFDPYVCCLREEGELADELKAAGVPVFCLHKRCPLDLRMLLRLKRKLKELRIDIVHTHLFTAGLWGCLAAKMAGVRRIITSEHSIDVGLGRFKRFVDRRVSRWSDLVVAKADAIAQYLTESKKIPTDKIAVVPNGVDVGKYGKSDRAQVRREMGVPEEKFLVGAVGRLSPEKDYDNLLRALAQIREPDFAAWIIGDGALKDELALTARSLDLGDRVSFLGGRDDVARLLSALDVFVLPSKREGMPLSLLEAMAAGLATVVTDVGGCAEVVIDGQNGLVVKARDPKALAEALSSLSHNPRRREELGAKARQTISDGYSLDRAVRRIEEIYTGDE